MNRRDLLTGAGSLLGTVALGGCLSRYGVPAGGDGTTTTAQPTILDQSLEVLDAGCGQSTGDASVAFDESQSRVTVTGTIPGSDLCHTAKLADVRYSEDESTLEIVVQSVRREDAEVCGQCITQIDYEATADFEGGLPAAVTVVHQGLDGEQTVATAQS